MFSKKNSSRVTDRKQPTPDSTLPKLQRLTQLQSQIISILGKKNIVLDEEADIFSRLEDIYVNSLQAAGLGLEVLERCLRILGDCESPPRVRFLYLYAHEMKLKGAAADEVEPVLLQSFHSNLLLRSKVDLGFKSGLVFCQISEHHAEVDKILCNIIVALEQELGYKPQKKNKAQSISLNSNAQTKAIYLGKRPSHKSIAKNSHNKIHKLQLFKFLFEAFLTGEWKVQSQAKKHYYAACKEELKGRLIRQYPGREMQKKLNAIEEQRFASLRDFSLKIKQNWKEQESEVVPNRSLSKTKKTSNGKFIRSQSQLSSTQCFQTMKGSFCKEVNESKSTVTTPQASTWSTPSRAAGFKLHLRKKSQHKLAPKEKADCINKQAKENNTIQEQTQQQFSYAKPEPYPELTRLVFKETPENTKEIVLKFDKLQNEPKLQVKKKKLKHTFNWEKGHKENQVERVVDILCLPQIKEQPSRDFSPSVEIKPQEEIHEEQPQPETIQEQFVQEEVIQTAQAIQPSVSDLNSARRIDLILKEGVEWMANLQNQARQQSKPASNQEISQCQLVPEKQLKQQKSFLDPLNIKQQREQESSQERSYKILIKPLDKPELQMLIGEQVTEYLQKTSQSLIEKHMQRQEDKEKRKVSKLNEVIKKNIFIKECEVSIEMKREQEAQDCSKTFELEIGYQSEEFVSETKTIQQKLQEIIEKQPIQQQDKTESVVEQSSSNIKELENVIKESSKEIDFSTQSEVIQEWLQQIFSSLSQQISSESNHNLEPIFPQMQPKTVKHQCSIKQDIFYEENSFPQQEVIEENSCSYDDKEMDSQIESVKETDNLAIEPTNNGYLAPLKQQDKRDDLSSFTCSRFAGSKIDTEKESDLQWRSQMNFMNEIFKEDKIAERQPDKDNSFEKRTKNMMREEIEEIQGSSRMCRSRTQSDISNNTNLRQQLTSRTLKREKTHNCLSICYDDNYDSVTHSSKKFTHWLCPELKVKKDTIAFSIYNKDEQHQREIAIPSFIPINDDTVKEISAKVELFLLKYPSKRNLSLEDWEETKKQVDSFDLLPEQADIRPFILVDKDTREQDEVRCTVNLKQNKIYIQSLILGLKTHPIIASSSQQLQQIISKLDSSQMSIRDKDLIVKNVWSFIGQRNIKLREKTDNKVHHFTFNILQKCKDQYKFDYWVQELQGESFKIQAIQESKRARIVKNMDTIIGFVLKVANEKVQFNTKSLNQFLSIL